MRLIENVTDTLRFKSIHLSFHIKDIYEMQKPKQKA